MATLSYLTVLKGMKRLFSPSPAINKDDLKNQKLLLSLLQLMINLIYGSVYDHSLSARRVSYSDPDLSLKSSFNYGTHTSATSRADLHVSCLPLQCIFNSREQQLPEYDNKSKEKKS